MQQSLFEDFSRPTKSDDLSIAKKVNKKKSKAPTTVKSGLLSLLKLIREKVESSLGKYKDEYLTINDEDVLVKYINQCLLNNVVSIDTETTGLNPFVDKIVGICIYTPGEKPAYIPLRHRSPITMEILPNQLTVEIVARELGRLSNIYQGIYFNAPFDIRFIQNDLGVRLHCTWDCKLGARIMNENEDSNALKPLHQKYVLNGQEDEFKFSELFKGTTFDFIPIDIATLYGAHDAVITYELKKFQERYLYYDPTCRNDDRNGMNGASWTFFNIEIPCIEATIELEQNGICLDVGYANELSVKYHAMENEILDTFYSELKNYDNQITSYRLSSSAVKFDDPINIGSPQQLAVLLYDILKYPIVDKKKPRGTGEDILSKIKAELTRHKIDTTIIDKILEYRGVDKLLSTYIDKLPNCLEADGKVHGTFNQYGADTGRFSSSDPNLQNIPSHNKDIRKMFIPDNGSIYVEEKDSCFTVNRWCEVETPNGFVSASSVKVGDKLRVVDDGNYEEIFVNRIEVLVDKIQIIFYY